MPVYLWGRESKRDATRAAEEELNRSGVSYKVKYFSEDVADGWGDDAVLITAFGSFAGIDEICRAIPYLRVPVGDSAQR